jgi:hypothetical protein
MGALVNVDAGSVVTGLMDGFDSLFTSDEERENAKLKMHVLLQKPHMMQALTNLEEAKHTSWFVAGWRPALGWLCVMLLGYAWVGRDFIIIGLSLTGNPATIALLPVVASSEMMTLVLALLGLGGIRMNEKIKGKARS